MGGSSGTNAATQQANTLNGNTALGTQQSQSAAQNSPQMQQLMAQYGSGNMSLQQALQQAGGIQGGMNALASNGVTGSEMAANEVQNGGLTSGLFGQGGIQDQSQAQSGNLANNLQQDRQALSGNDQSYGLNSQDLAAYGQASGNIANQYGAAGNNLAQSLASRGLGAAGSGVAAQSFSTLGGSQNEQLAQAQQQIAQNRIQTAQNLAQFRTQADVQQQAQNNQLMQGLGQLGQSAQQNQYGRQLAGSEDQYNQLAGTAAAGMQNQGLQQNIANSQFAQQQATKTPDLGDALSQGFVSGAGSSAQQVAASPGTGATSFSKSFGSSLGSMM